MGRTVTLTIKKQYFDAILSGEKTVEYRDFKDYFIRLFEGDQPTHLKLHYQSGRFLLARIVDIKLVKTPHHLKASGIPFGEKVFAIQLANPKILKEESWVA